MYQQDWLMKQIEMTVDVIAKIVFKKNHMLFNVYEESNSEEAHRLHELLIDLISQQRICDAENILFESMNHHKLIYMKIAIDFYNRINQLSDEELQRGNFTRDEIKLGIEDTLKRYSISLPTQFNRQSH